MPTTYQYPLERERDVHRRWKHLLQRTVAPKNYATEYRAASPSRATFDSATAHRLSSTTARSIKSPDGRKCAVE